MTEQVSSLPPDVGTAVVEQERIQGGGMETLSLAWWQMIAWWMAGSLQYLAHCLGTSALLGRIDL